MISFQGVTFTYPHGAPIFEDFNWHVGAGEAWAVLGPSGSGKSTLLYLLAGLRQATSGRITVDQTPLERPRPRTGLILQDYGLLPWATLYENVALGLRIRAFYGPDRQHAPQDDLVRDIPARIEPWLTRLGLSTLRDSYPAQISGGQRQRAAVARTLALNPDLLLMDEPFASLDAPTRETLQDLILSLRQEQNLTTIIVTHAIEEAALLGRRVLVLSTPPHHQPNVIDNPHAAQPAFRGTPGYQAACNRLREALMETP